MALFFNEAKDTATPGKISHVGVMYSQSMLSIIPISVSPPNTTSVLIRNSYRIAATTDPICFEEDYNIDEAKKLLSELYDKKYIRLYEIAKNRNTINDYLSFLKDNQ